MDSKSLGSAQMKEDLLVLNVIYCLDWQWDTRVWSHEGGYPGDGFYIVYMDSERLGSASMKEDLLVFDVVNCLEGQWVPRVCVNEEGSASVWCLDEQWEPQVCSDEGESSGVWFHVLFRCTLRSYGLLKWRRTFWCLISYDV